MYNFDGTVVFLDFGYGYMILCFQNLPNQTLIQGDFTACKEYLNNK